MMAPKDGRKVMFVSWWQIALVLVLLLFVTVVITATVESNGQAPAVLENACTNAVSENTNLISVTVVMVNYAGWHYTSDHTVIERNDTHERGILIGANWGHTGDVFHLREVLFDGRY